MRYDNTQRKKKDSPFERRDIAIDAVWDIEAESWDKFVVGGLLYCDGHYRQFSWKEQTDMVDALLEIDGTVWAHFGGGYDMKWVLDILGPRGVKAKITHAGARIVSIRVGRTLFCDSFALAPMSLAKFTKGLANKKTRLDFPCVCGKECGGYCSIKRNMPGTMMRQLCKYLKDDCLALMAALENLQKYAAINKLDLGMTIGGSAWRNAKRTLELDGAEWGSGDYSFARKAYFGGRVQLLRQGLIPRAWEYDVNSMYPWSLRSFELPIGSRSKVFGKDAQAAFHRGEPGIYSATVDVPTMHLPPLPYRYDKARAVAYPTGAFYGIWTAPELAYAKSLGVKVTILEGLVWESKRVIFKAWIDRLWSLRKGAPGGKKSPIGEWLKLFMNSLTGKFGANPDHERLCMNPTEVKGCRCLCADCGKSARRCKCPLFRVERCKCNPWRQVSDYVWAQREWRIDECAHVHWAAYLTSQARVAWHKQAIADGVGGRSVIYGDTDSLFADKERTGNIGKDLGQWDCAGPLINFEGIAPKVYGFECLPGCERHMNQETGELCPGGQITAKAKGMTLPKKGGKHTRPAVFKCADKWRITEDGATCSDHPDLSCPGLYSKEGVIGFKAGLRAPRFFFARKLTRKLRARTGDRILEKGELGRQGFTRAPRVGELAP